MLFTPRDNIYDTDADRIVKSKMDNSYAQTIAINQCFQAEALTDWRFFSGDQSLQQELYGNVSGNNPIHFSFNRMRRVVNLITGHQRRNRRSIIVIPIENGDNETADQFTKVLLWICMQDSVLETMSQALESAVVCGLSLLQVWLDYTNDPVSGNIKVDKLDFNSFIIDPFFRKHDLSDCQFIWKRAFLSKREVIALFPAKEEEILSMTDMSSGRGQDGRFALLPESYNWSISNLVAYDEYYYRTFRRQKMLVDTDTGEVQEWKSQNNDGLKAFMEEYPQLEMIEQDVPTIRMAIVCQDRVLYDGPLPMGIDIFPFVAVLCYFAPQLPYLPFRIQGVCRGLRDAQYLFNRRKVIELKIMEAQVTAGFKFKIGALLDPGSIYLSGEGRGIGLKDSASMSDVERIEAPSIPSSMIELSKLLGEEINQISGVSEELLGFDNKDQSGYHMALKTSQSTTTLQIIYDQFDTVHKLMGNIFILLVQANFSTGKVQRILEGEKPMPQFFNKAFGVYHACAAEGYDTQTQRQMQLEQMIRFKELGVPIPAEDLLEAATMQNKSRVIANIQKAEKQQAEMQQKQAEMAMALQQAEMELFQARSKADMGLYYERTSRVEDNRSLADERRHKANSEDQRALLDNVKTIHELESMKLKDFISMLTTMKQLKAGEAQDSHDDNNAVPV